MNCRSRTDCLYLVNDTRQPSFGLGDFPAISTTGPSPPSPDHLTALGSSTIPGRRKIEMPRRRISRNSPGCADHENEDTGQQWLRRHRSREKVDSGQEDHRQTVDPRPLDRVPEMKQCSANCNPKNIYSPQGRDC